MEGRGGGGAEKCPGREGPSGRRAPEKEELGNGILEGPGNERQGGAAGRIRRAGRRCHGRLKFLFSFLGSQIPFAVARGKKEKKVYIKLFSVYSRTSTMILIQLQFSLPSFKKSPRPKVFLFPFSTVPEHMSARARVVYNFHCRVCYKGGEGGNTSEFEGFDYAERWRFSVWLVVYSYSGVTPAEGPAHAGG